MSEQWMCLDCLQVGPLNRKGQCGTCGSEAVAFPEGKEQCNRQATILDTENTVKPSAKGNGTRQRGGLFIAPMKIATGNRSDEKKSESGSVVKCTPRFRS